MYGYICPYCGDHLDPGEHCECQEEKEESRKAIENLMIPDCNGQMTLKEAIA